MVANGGYDIIRISEQHCDVIKLHMPLMKLAKKTLRELSVVSALSIIF
jgi:hypothetical protein